MTKQKRDRKVTPADVTESFSASGITTKKLDDTQQVVHDCIILDEVEDRSNPIEAIMAHWKELSKND